MAHNRYPTGPSGRDIGKPEKHTIIRFDEKVAGEYAAMLQKRGELGARRSVVFAKQDEAVKAMGEAVAAGEPWEPIAKELNDLRLEEEALEAGIKYLDGQVGLMLRLHHWLKS